MAWDSGAGCGPAWDTPATTGVFNYGGGGFQDSIGGNAFGNDGSAANGGDGGDGGCFNCGKQGHIKSECPMPRKAVENSGLCYNCGETGHNKAECTNPAVAREFTGECRLCGESGHRASDCPSAPPKTCKNCLQEGHAITDCKNPRAIDRSNVTDVAGDIAWKTLRTAIEEKDIDDVKTSIEQYIKAIPGTTYFDLEKSFRAQDMNLWIIAMEKEVLDTYTIMDLQGNLDKKFCVSYRFSDKPRRPKEKEGWPASLEENMERLKNAGEPVDRGIPKCANCGVVGHMLKSCPEEKVEPTDKVSVKCFNCDEIGHRVRDCPNPRPDRFACRNCGKSGHSSKECPEPQVDRPDMECRKCGEMGHSSRNCPQGGGSGSRACRNCGQEGHRAAECTNEHVDICRNCDAIGHLSKECDKPKDWSRVKCSNCQQFGHGKARCKEPLVEDGVGDAGGGAGMGASDAFGSGDTAAPVTDDAGGGDSWGAGGGGGGDGW